MKLETIGALFLGAWTRFTERFEVAIKVFAIPGVLFIIEQALLGRGTYAAGALGGLIGLLDGLASFIASIALVGVYGKGMGFGQAYRFSFSLFWQYVWVAILVGLAFIGGFIMLIIPGIMLIIQFAFTNFTIALDGRRGLAALSSSREYVKGYWWAVLGRILLLLLLLIAAMIIFYQPFHLLFGGITGGIMYGLIIWAFSMFSMAYNIEIFENLRRLKPAVAGAATGEGSGFLKVAFVVGIIGVVALAVLIPLGIFATIHYADQYSNTGSGSFMPGSTSGSSTDQWYPNTPSAPSGTKEYLQ